MPDDHDPFSVLISTELALTGVRLIAADARPGDDARLEVIAYLAGQALHHTRRLHEALARAEREPGRAERVSS